MQRPQGFRLIRILQCRPDVASAHHGRRGRGGAVGVASSAIVVVRVSPMPHRPRRGVRRSGGIRGDFRRIALVVSRRYPCFRKAVLGPRQSRPDPRTGQPPLGDPELSAEPVPLHFCDMCLPCATHLEPVDLGVDVVVLASRTGPCEALAQAFMADASVTVARVTDRVGCSPGSWRKSTCPERPTRLTPPAGGQAAMNARKEFLWVHKTLVNSEQAHRRAQGRVFHACVACGECEPRRRPCPRPAPQMWNIRPRRPSCIPKIKY